MTIEKPKFDKVAYAKSWEEAHKDERKAYKAARSVIPEVREASLAKQKDWCLKKKEHRQEYSRQYHYGVSPDTYKKMMKSQEGVCYFCKSDNNGDALCVDHKHVDGYKHLPSEEKAKLVRGLLCQPCNKLLGMCKDNVEQLLKLADGLKANIKTYLNPEPRPHLYLLTGSPGAGKSHILKNLANTAYDCIDTDKVRLVDAIKLAKNASNPIMTLTMGVSTFLSRNSDQFNITLLVIQEPLETLQRRIQDRGGIAKTDTLERRIKRMDSFAQQATMSGTSEQVLSWLVEQEPLST